MRSGLIFNVSTRIPNRFLLCRMLAASARKMHREGNSTAQSINDSLTALKNSSGSQEAMMAQADAPSDAQVVDGLIAEPSLS